MTDASEVQAARILVVTGEALAVGKTALFEKILAIGKMSDATSAKVFFLILMGVLCEVSLPFNQQFEARMEAFVRGWTRGFDRAFLKALNIRPFRIGGEYG